MGERAYVMRGKLRRPARRRQENKDNWAIRSTFSRQSTESRAAAQFTVAPPQHFLYFFPEPHGHGSFRPTLDVVRRGSGVKAVPA